MADFSDRMTSFTDQLRGSIRMREEALSRVHEATDELLDGARSFLGQVAEEHRDRAKELHATLASDRQGCCRKVAEMRHSHQDSLRKMRGEMHEMLSSTRKVRQDTVHQMSQRFQQARNELARDLRGAADAWREFASSR